ncbi:MAG: hypothetical protein DRP93_01345 [Candidatus Neomarinimicrobiota bacterium]|nr:MAG: hypothetical protein DRP93_01345 [Candidatus Neomarinimicrobiota bacterium]
MEYKNIAPKVHKLETLVDELIQSGEVPQDFKQSSEYKKIFTKEALKDNILSVDDAIKSGNISEQEALKEGFIDIDKQRGEPSGVRAKASFADTQKGKLDYLSQQYGKENVGEYDGDVIVKKDGKWSKFDADSLEMADVADWAGEIPEVVGSIGGGIAGLASGGLGSIAGAGLGGAGGRGVKKVIANTLGVKDNQSPMQIIEDMGTSGAMAMGGEAAGIGISKLIGKALAPNATRYGAKERSLEELADKIGIRLTPADTMGGSLTAIENALGYGMGGGKITSLKADQFRTLKDFLTNSIKDRTGGRSTSEIGESLQQGITQGVETTRRSFNTKYDDLMNMVSDGEITLNQASKVATNLLKESSDDVLKPFIDNSTITQLKAIAGVTDNATKVPTVDYNTFKTLRTNVNELGASNNIVGNTQGGKFKQVAKGLNKDFDEFAQTRGIGGEKEAIDRAYGSFKGDLSRPEIKRVVGTPKSNPINPENVVDTILTPRGESRAAKVLEYGAQPRDLESGLLNRYLEKATSRTKDGDEFISPAKLDSARFRNSAIEGSVLPAPSSKILDDYSTMSRTVGASSPANLNPSGTARTLGNYADIVSLGTIPTARAVASGAYTSPTAYKLLTKGYLNDQKRKTMNKIMGGFGAGAFPAMEE